jgi:phosphatidate cytidylyltransferase
VKQRIITGLLIAAVVLPTFLMGGWIMELVVMAFVFLALYETYAIKKTEWPIWIFLCMLVSLSVLSYTPNNYVLFAIIGLILFMYLISIVFEWLTPIDIGYLVTMIILFTGTLKSVNFILDDLGRIVLIYMLVVTYTTDTAAYFIGYFFGKHKLNTRISPKKTIEGSIGGWIIGFAFGLIYGLLFIKNISLPIMIGANIILPIIGQIGDLAFSDIKRFIGIKDFGSIFPAHGGVLDRIDSLIFNLVFFYIFINLL